MSRKSLFLDYNQVILYQSKNIVKSFETNVRINLQVHSIFKYYHFQRFG